MIKRFDKKENLGITLIALVITIVVLIILAGIIISITIGNGGIIDRAKTAKQEYANVEEYEQTQIAKTANEIDSYVDGNRGTVTLTQEEYAQFKALVEERNKKYNYSTEEQVIGTWIDNKPLYQRTYVITAIPNNNMTQTPHNISNLGSLVNVFGAMHTTNGGYTMIPRVQDNSTTLNMGVDITNSVIQLKSRSANLANTFDYVNITLQYTKTTD